MTTKPIADFSDLAGRWTPDPLFDEVLATERQIDRDKWERPDAASPPPVNLPPPSA